MPSVIGGNYFWPLGDVPAGKSGRLVFVVDTAPDFYPKTGQTPTILGSSGRIRVNGYSGPIQNTDTSGSLIAGPVFELFKTASLPKILAGETATFSLVLGNATGPNDTVQGKLREDAQNTSSVTLTEVLPGNAAFVSATGAHTYNAQNRSVVWTLPQLRVSERVTVTVTLRLADNATNCTAINNSTLNVTSKDMPFLRNQTARYTVNGRGASTTVQQPVMIELSATPGTIFAQGQTSLLVKVKNFTSSATQPLTLTLSVPGLLSSPTPPSGQIEGTSINWRSVVLPPGTPTAPSETRFAAVLRVDRVIGGRGATAAIQAPPPIPQSCILAARTTVNVQPLIELTKFVSDDFVRLGDTVTYRIEAKNVGDSSVSGLIITDTLPSGRGNFRFLREVNGTPPPTTNLNGENRVVAWQFPPGDLIAPGQTRVLEFQASADGVPGVGGCYDNRVFADSLESQIRERAGGRVCLEAPFTVEKIITPGNVDPRAPNREVTVSWRITEVYRPEKAKPVGRIWLKEEPQTNAYSIGTGSKSANELEFVAVISDTVTPEPDPNTGSLIDGIEDADGGVLWRNVPLAEGGSASGTIRMRIPAGARTGAIFDDIFCVGYEPEEDYGWCIYDDARVSLNARILRVSKSVDRERVSLGERVKYRVEAFYDTPDGDTASGVTISDTLPLEFQYAGPAPGFPAPSQIRTVIENGEPRTQLLWTNRSIGPKQRVAIEFYARASTFIGTYANWAWAESSAPPEQRPTVECSGTCIQGTSGPIAVARDVRTEQRITISPEVIYGTSPYTRAGLIDYKISLVSSNDIAYTSTVVTATLPSGFTYDSMVGTGQPQPERLPGGLLVWRGITVPAKSGGTGGLYILRLRARAANKFGIFRMRVAASSPTGTIPTVDNGAPLIFGAAGPTLSLAAPPLVDIGSTFVMAHNIINPEALTLTVQAVTVTLPSGLEYAGMVLSGTNSPRLTTTPTATLLSWQNLLVPPERNDELGLLVLDFLVKAPDSRSVFTARSTIRADKSVDTSSAATTFLVDETRFVWVPMIIRR